MRGGLGEGEGRMQRGVEGKGLIVCRKRELLRVTRARRTAWANGVGLMR